MVDFITTNKIAKTNTESIAAAAAALAGKAYRLDIMRWVTAALLAAANAFHWYKGLPSLSDLWNGVNFIGGNQTAVIWFGSILLAVTIFVIILNFIEPKRAKIEIID